MNTWKPIDCNELEDLLDQQLADCTPEQRNVFEQHRVPFYKVPIHRMGDIEEVFVVAKFDTGILYYEDVEEGFEFDVPGEDGAIPVQGCNQYSLGQALSRISFNSSTLTLRASELSR